MSRLMHQMTCLTLNTLEKSDGWTLRNKSLTYLKTNIFEQIIAILHFTVI